MYRTLPLVLFLLTANLFADSYQGKAAIPDLTITTASGFDVTNLGVDVPVKDIIAKAQDLDADVIACSSLLTTSMPSLLWAGMVRCAD